MVRPDPIDCDDAMGELLRSALEPTPATCERVKRRALAVESGRSRPNPEPRRRWRPAAAAAALLALGAFVLALAVWLPRQERPGTSVGDAEGAVAPVADPARPGSGGHYRVSNGDGVVLVRRGDQVVAMIGRGGKP